MPVRTIRRDNHALSKEVHDLMSPAERRWRKAEILQREHLNQVLDAFPAASSMEEFEKYNALHQKHDRVCAIYEAALKAWLVELTHS